MPVLDGRQPANVLLLIIGVGLLSVSLLAEVIGIGDDPGFGMQQTMGSLAGVVITIAAVYLITRSAGQP